jgi:hypothetical protein
MSKTIPIPIKKKDTQKIPIKKRYAKTFPPIREPITVAMAATLLIPPKAIPCCSFGISGEKREQKKKRKR